MTALPPDLLAAAPAALGPVGMLASALGAVAGAPVATPLATPFATPIPPVALLVLCAVAAVGTMLLMPRRGAGAARLIGGGVLALAAVAFAGLVIRWSVGGGFTLANVYFWAFAAIALFSSMRVVTHRKPVYSALYFVLTVFSTAGLFVMLYAEFMAAALVLIYAGAILVAYVFVIMLAAEASPAAAQGDDFVELLAEHDTVSRDPIVASVVAFALLGVLLFVVTDRFVAPPRSGDAAAAGVADGATNGAVASAVAAAVASEANPASAAATPVGDIADRQTGAPEPVAAAVVEPDYPVVQGATQELGEYLFRDQLIGLQVAATILTLSVIGAIVISRRQVLIPETAEGGAPGQETRVGPVTSGVDDNPKNIPIYGTRDASHKAYPET